MNGSDVLDRSENTQRLDSFPNFRRSEWAFCSWHKCEVLRCPLYSRYRGKSGSDTDIVKLSRMTQLGHVAVKACTVARLRVIPPEFSIDLAA